MVPAGRAGWVVLLRCGGGLARIRVGCPLTPVVSLGLRARGLVWRRGPTVKGHALLLRARRSEFRFPIEARIAQACGQQLKNARLVLPDQQPGIRLPACVVLQHGHARAGLRLIVTPSSILRW